MLAEPLRLRVLALAAAEELAIGELAQLLGESQPNVSRHLKSLRSAGLLAERKEGTRVFVRLGNDVQDDAVVADALKAGSSLCKADGSLNRIADVVRGRDADARRLFEEKDADATGWPSELSAYLSVLAPLIGKRGLAVDVGTGDGGLLEVLAPVFERVVGIDRSAKQLSIARARLQRRGFGNVDLRQADLDDPSLEELVGAADVVFAARVLHHAPRPAVAVKTLARWVAPGGTLVVLDYMAHADERLRTEWADAWLGFEAAELEAMFAQAGLLQTTVMPIEPPRCGHGPDGHLSWQVVSGKKQSSG